MLSQVSQAAGGGLRSTNSDSARLKSARAFANSPTPACYEPHAFRKRRSQGSRAEISSLTGIWWKITLKH